MPTQAARQTTINLRAPVARRALIDQAAEILGKSRTDFMLDAASEKAQQVLLDRTVFALDTARFAKFTHALEAALPNTKAVKKLLQRKAPWE